MQVRQKEAAFRCCPKATVPAEESMETAYREARSSQQVRAAEDLRELYSTAGVLLVDARGHGVIAAKIASTVHDTFHGAIHALVSNKNGKRATENGFHDCWRWSSTERIRSR